VRFHNAIRELTGRRGIRDDVSRYEAASLALVDPAGADPGQVISNYPSEDSPLRIERFFQALYQRYDERYVYSAPDLKSVTRRREWAQASPVFDDAIADGRPQIRSEYEYRIATSIDDEE